MDCLIIDLCFGVVCCWYASECVVLCPTACLIEIVKVSRDFDVCNIRGDGPVGVVVPYFCEHIWHTVTCLGPHAPYFMSASTRVTAMCDSAIMLCDPGWGNTKMISITFLCPVKCVKHCSSCICTHSSHYLTPPPPLLTSPHTAVSLTA